MQEGARKYFLSYDELIKKNFYSMNVIEDVF